MMLLLLFFSPHGLIQKNIFLIYVKNRTLRVLDLFLLYLKTISTEQGQHSEWHIQECAQSLRYKKDSG